jgi:hypothetical protein
MSRSLIGSRAALIAALRAQEVALAAAETAARAAGAASAAAARAAFAVEGAAKPPAAQAAALRAFDYACAAALEAAAGAIAALLIARRAALAERRRALAEGLFLDALFIVAQFPGGQVAEAEKCAYAFDVRACAGLCRATWAEEAFWSGLVRVAHPGPRKLTRLMYAVARGDAARTAWLLARGAPREARDVHGWTALHFASWKGHVDAVRALLAAGANIEAASKGVTPPRAAACERGDLHGARRELL